MMTLLQRIRETVGAVSPKTRRRLAWTLAVIVILQLYFVRELIAAELLFGMLFAAIFLFVAICYTLGNAWEYGVVWGEVGVKAIAMTARRGYGVLEYVSNGVMESISKRQGRHQHSGSAQ
jgi:signal transduction histidine kinase